LRKEDGEISFTDNSGWTISKKIAMFLSTAFVVTCVSIGLIVYYVGVANVACPNDDASKPTAKPSVDATPPKSAKSTVNDFNDEWSRWCRQFCPTVFSSNMTSLPL
jgi:hypothetical protein